MWLTWFLCLFQVSLNKLVRQEQLHCVALPEHKVPLVCLGKIVSLNQLVIWKETVHLADWRRMNVLPTTESVASAATICAAAGDVPSTRDTH